MNRRQLLKKSALSLAVLSFMNLSMAISAFAEDAVKAIEGKLGYLNVSKNPNKRCDNCKSFNKELGQCNLVAMKKAMNAQSVVVEAPGYCHMWAKI